MARRMPLPSPVARLILPDLVVSRTDVNRLKRELDTLGQALSDSKIRSPNAQPVLPPTSHLLEEFAMLNKLDWLEAGHRKQAAEFFVATQSEAPVVHISFAVDPSSSFMSKLVIWFRHNIHPLTLINIGLQPNIAAGCVVRTTNQVFDFSLRGRFTANRQLLIDKMHNAERSRK